MAMRFSGNRGVQGEGGRWEHSRLAEQSEHTQHLWCLLSYIEMVH